MFDPLEGWSYVDDDTDPSVDKVDPGYGGQPYDVEKLGLVVTNETVYFMLQTGFDLENGFGGNLPGDFALYTNYDGSNDFAEYAIRFSFTDSVISMDLFNATSWLNPVSFGQGVYPWRMSSSAGPSRGSIFAEYNTLAIDDSTPGVLTNYLEASFDRKLFGNAVLGDEWLLSWTMQCGNDVLQHTASPAPVPEPTTMLLLGTGLIGLATFGRKKVFKQ